jgi:hypothetical protein
MQASETNNALFPPLDSNNDKSGKEQVKFKWDWESQGSITYGYSGINASEKIASFDMVREFVWFIYLKKKIRKTYDMLAILCFVFFLFKIPLY